MSPVSNQYCVAIIAGEESGDQHGAKLVTAMQKKHPALFFCGIGGAALGQAGVRIVVEASELTVVGITEVFAKIPAILKGMATIKKLLKSLRPDLLILIDFPDFNLHIGAVAKKLGIPMDTQNPEETEKPKMVRTGNKRTIHGFACEEVLVYNSNEGRNVPR